MNSVRKQIWNVDLSATFKMSKMSFEIRGQIIDHMVNIVYEPVREQIIRNVQDGVVEQANIVYQL